MFLTTPHSPNPASRKLYLHLIVIALLVSGALCLDGRRSARAAQNLIKITPVSAASFTSQTPIAPGSIAALFLDGNVVSPGTFIVGNDTDPSTPGVQLPRILENLSVEVHGKTASIFFLSAQQWNILLPVDLEPGVGPVVIRDSTGVIRAAGEIDVARVIPGIFTANGSGQGAPAAYLLRINLGTGEQRLEQVADFDPLAQKFVPRPIDLERGDELVVLVLFLTGARGIKNENETRILIGGEQYIPGFVGAAPGFLGLEQVNLILPRSLPAGLLQLNLLYLADGRAANVCEIEIAPPAGAPPSIRGLSKADAQAGEVIDVTGTGFTPDSEVLIIDNARKAYSAKLMESTTTSMKVMVPFGAGTGNLTVRNARGEASFPFRIRTSVSGIVQRTIPQNNGDALRVGIPNARILFRRNNTEQTALTNEDGSFLLTDLTETARFAFEVEGATNGPLPFPKDKRSIRVVAGRDNQYEGYIELKEITGPTAVTGSNGAMTQTLSAPLQVTDESAQPQTVIFDPQGSMVRFPDGTVVNNVTVTALNPSRVPANLPPAQFSSTIVQLTPFGATLDPGGRLSFPNTDGYAANEVVTLFRFDQSEGSNTLGSFVAAGQARVTTDGQRVETASNAIKQTTYYFVSKTRSVTTIYGKVVEEIGGGMVRPARGALVQVRGQSIFSLSDQSGTYLLPNVPIPNDEALTKGLGIEVSFLRPDGTVDRVDRDGLMPGNNGFTFVDPPIRIITDEISRSPVILAPKNLTIEAGKQSDFNFIANARVAGRTLSSVQVLGAVFATVGSLGSDKYVLRLAPGATVSGTFTLELRATDSQGERTSETVLLEVKAAQANMPIATSQSLNTNEDQPVNVTLMGTGGNRFRVISDPRRGRLSGVLPNLVYTPVDDFNGTDTFSFVLGNGTVESAPAVVTINVTAVSDAPRLMVGERFVTNIGQRLAIVINGFDGDADQQLTLTGTGLPAGALIRQVSSNSWVLEWRPTNQQIGSYTVNLRLSDNGTPVQSASKSIVIVVEATWAQTSGPGGGNCLAFAVQGKSVFAGTIGGGVFRTTDNGVNWTQVNNGLTNTNVFALAMSGTTLFAGTRLGGVFRSTDNGANWIQVNNGLTNLIVYALTINGTTLYAGTDGGGVYRTSDSGANWTKVNNGLPGSNVLSLSVSGTTLFAGTFGSGVYRSTDNGANWTQVINGLTNSIVYALAASGTTLFAGTAGGGVYRTENSGANWTQVINGLTSLDIRALRVNGTTLYVGTLSGGGVFQTTNGGTNWTPFNNGLIGIDVYALSVSGATLFAGTIDGVYRTAEGAANWIQINNGLIGTIGTALAVSGTTLYSGTYGGGVYRTTDSGVNWTQVNNGLTNRDVFALAVSGTTLFAGTFGGGVYRTTDNGVNWTQHNNGLTNTNVFALAVGGSTLFAGTFGGGVFRSPDNGANWTQVNNGLTSLDVSSLAVGGTTLFAGTLGGGVFRSPDNGANWTRVNNGLTNTQVNALVANGTTLFAGTNGGGVYRTDDSGANWTQVNNGLTNIIVNALTINGTTLLAGTDAGVFRTTDNGANWSPINNGLTSTSVFSLALKGATLFAGTFGGGVFILAEADLVWSESNTGLGNRFINTAIASGAQTLVGTFEGGVYRSGDAGSSWISSSTGLPPSADVRAFTRHNNTIFAGLIGDGVFVSMDDGGSWAGRSNGLGNRQVNALASDGVRLIAGTEGGIYRSIDNGASWSLANSGITAQKILSLLATPSGLYAGTNLGLYRSTNNGDTWAAVNTGLTDLYIVSLGVAPNGIAIFAGTTSGVFRSTNSGGNWARVTSGLPERVTALTFITAGTRFLSGTVFGFYVSEDNGSTWRGSSTGLLNLQVSGLAVQDNRVIAGTRSAGVFVSQLQ
jgi:uncharacterized protein (TIGR03437 family)